MSGLRPVWCTDSQPAGAFCYLFDLDTGAGQTQTSRSTAETAVMSDSDGHPDAQIVTLDEETTLSTAGSGIPGAAPCPTQPTLTCIAQPTGENVVTIHVTDPEDGTGTTVSINKDGETTEHDATGYHRTQDDADVTQRWQDDVGDTADDDDLPVIWASNGTQSREEQINKQRLEEEIYSRGQPYVVCFEDVTFTRTNKDGTTEEVTVPGGDCVVVTP